MTARRKDQKDEVETGPMFLPPPSRRRTARTVATGPSWDKRLVDFEIESLVRMYFWACRRFFSLSVD